MKRELETRPCFLIDNEIIRIKNSQTKMIGIVKLLRMRSFIIF